MDIETYNPYSPLLSRNRWRRCCWRRRRTRRGAWRTEPRACSTTPCRRRDVCPFSGLYVHESQHRRAEGPRTTRPPPPRCHSARPRQRCSLHSKSRSATCTYTPHRHRHSLDTLPTDTRTGTDSRSSGRQPAPARGGAGGSHARGGAATGGRCGVERLHEAAAGPDRTRMTPPPPTPLRFASHASSALRHSGDICRSCGCCSRAARIRTSVFRSIWPRTRVFSRLSTS